MEGEDMSGDIKELESVEVDNCLGWEEERKGWYGREKSTRIPRFLFGMTKWKKGNE